MWDDNTWDEMGLNLGIPKVIPFMFPKGTFVNRNQ